jgi:transcription termination factor Rho
MPRKVATVSDEPEPKKKTTKKAATTAVKKTAVKKKASPAAEPAEPVAEEKPKRATRKKAAAPVEEVIEAAPAPAAPAPAPKAKRTRKAAAADEAPELPLTEKPVPAAEPAPQPAAAPPQQTAPAAPVTPAPQPASAPPARENYDWRPSAPAPAPAPAGDGRPRPLYISREVEAFLRAANIPLPTEKGQLDAIMAAMSAAKAAAQAAASSYAPPAPRAEQQPSPPGQPGQQSQPQQHSQHRQHRDHRDQRQPREPREHRDRPPREPREPRESRDPREQRDPREPREQRDPNEPQPDPSGAVPRPDEPIELVETEGYCEISGKGFGFLRDPKRLFQPSPSDVFVTPELVKRYGLRDGHWLSCSARKNNRGMQIHRLHTVNGQPPEAVKSWPSFEDLTTISPLEHIKLETAPDRTTTRVMDLMTPIGKGQRGLIVAPPRTGKTTLLNHIAEAVVKNHPDMKLLILLVDERPEEVTDFKRAVPQAELWASSNDMDVKSHTRVATLAIERARRLVESGSDVFILLDSITRLGRAFNNAVVGGSRTMSGGVDARALEMPRKIFAAARNTEEAGSLTIVATALIETGSRMDELIFQEFKGTGNSEIVLDRKISDQRVYPAIDIFQSGTRREELILPADALHKINLIRRGLSGHKPLEAIERMLSFLKKFPTNEQLLREIPG